MANIKKISFLICFLVIHSSVYCQVRLYTLPEITNFFDINIPQTTDQVWDIKQTKDGLIYVASTNHFMEYDGVTWREFVSAIGTTFYSFEIDTANRNFYIGTTNSIIVHKFQNNNYQTDEIYIPERISSTWRTFIKDGKVYFFINKTDVIAYDDNNIELVQRDNDFKITRGFFVDNVLYGVSNNGIGKIEDNKLKIISQKNQDIFNQDIRVILEYSEDLLLIGTNKGNLYLYNKEYDKFDLLKTEAESYFKQNQLYYGAKIDDTTYALGTFKGGLVIINQKGQIINILTKKTGLLSNAIYYVFVDKHKNLWLGTGMGLSLVHWSSSIRFLDKRNQIDDLLDAFLVFSEYILAGTAEAMFYSEKTDDFQTVFKEFDYKNMYSGSYLSTVIDGNKFFLSTGYDNISVFSENLKHLCESEILRAVKIAQSPVVQNRFYVSNFNELVAVRLTKKNNSYCFEKEFIFYELPFNIENIIFDENNDLWLCQGKNLLLVDFNEEEDIFKYSSYFYDSNSGLPACKIYNVFDLNNTLFVSTALGLYYLQNKEDKFSEYKFAQYKIGYLSEVKDKIVISTVKTENYTFLLTNNTLYRINNSTEEIKSLFFNSVFDYYSSKLYIDNDYIWTFSKERIFCVNYKKFNDFTYPKNNLILKSIKIGQEKSHYLYNSDSIVKISDTVYLIQNKINSKSNNINFEFALPYYCKSDQTKFLYKISKKEENWEELSKNVLSLRSLSAGKYEIMVKATNYYGVESNTIYIKFKIKNKPYFSILAIIIYLVLLSVLIYFLAHLRNEKIKKEKRTLSDIVKQRTNQLEQQKEELESQSKVLVEQKNLLKKESERLELAIIELRQLSLVARKTDNSVLILEKNGRIEWWNRGFTDLFAYKIEQFKNISFRNAFVKIRPDIHREIANYTKDKGTISYTTQEVFDNGEEIWYQSTINPVYDDNGELFKFVIIDINISEIKNAENVVVKQKNEIKSLNEKLSKLTADLSITSENLKNYIKFDKINLMYAKFLHEIFTKNTVMDSPFIKYFIYDRPLDELSGDFIWSINYNNNLYVAIGDSTGHRVRGTIISVIGISVLKEIIIRNSNAGLDEILNVFNDKFFSIFNNSDNLKNQDSIDLALVRLCPEDKRLDFCGAKIPMYLIRHEFKHTLYSFEADRISIGSNTNKSFTNQFTKIKDFDRIYFTTDGWINQLGKMGQKKYTTKKFKDFLLTVQGSDIKNQRDLFKEELNKWRGNFEQVDDIFIFGAEINF